MKSLNLINFKIIIRLFFMLNVQRKKMKNKQHYFDTFFDGPFKKYYEELIDQAGKGKYKAINRLKEIEIIYNINEIKTSSDFSLFSFKCMDVNLKRENNLTIIYDSFNKYIKNIEKI